jgi:hypothetical protein
MRTSQYPRAVIDPCLSQRLTTHYGPPVLLLFSPDYFKAVITFMCKNMTTLTGYAVQSLLFATTGIRNIPIGFIPVV